MVSFTGSTHAGVAVSKAAAASVKRVTLELGGKGPNLLFADLGDGLGKAVQHGVSHLMRNYGLTSYLQTGSADRIRRVVPQLKAGMVEVNGERRSARSPFGGVKASGNGREGGEFGLREFLEVKAVSGWPR